MRIHKALLHAIDDVRWAGISRTDFVNALLQQWLEQNFEKLLTGPSCNLQPYETEGFREFLYKIRCKVGNGS